MNELVVKDDPLYLQVVMGQGITNQEQLSLIQDIMNALSENTRLAYRKSVEMYLATGRELPARPSEIADYVRTATVWKLKKGQLISTHQRLSFATLKSQAAALSFYHRCLGINPNPCDAIDVKMALKAAGNQMGTDAITQAKPLLKEDIIKILGTLRYEHDPSPIDLRDAAMILIGFTAALRRTEIVNLQVEDLRFTQEGVILNIRRSKRKNFNFKKAIAKTNQAICPVKTLKRWLTLAQIEEGYVFRSLRNTILGGKLPEIVISTRLKQLCEQAGIAVSVQHSTEDVELTISGHSLRAGFITECRRRGIADWVIMKTTGHKDARNLTVYTREIDLFENNASCDLWTVE